MDKYRLEIKPSAHKELERLDDSVLNRVVPRIEALRENPRPAGSRKLRGFKNDWRIRIGDYRVVYTIDDSCGIVDVARIRHRRDVYD